MAVDTKLILLRGNSGSGKTTVAKELHRQLGADAILISQDVFRREIFHVKDTPNNLAVGLMMESILYAQGKVRFVIVEGIFARKKYQDFFLFLLELFAEKSYSYYFALPFQLTVTRHQSRPQRVPFSKADLQKWWLEKDLLFNENKRDKLNHLSKKLVLPKEQLIMENQTVSEIVAMILQKLQ